MREGTVDAVKEDAPSVTCIDDQTSDAKVGIGTMTHPITTATTCYASVIYTFPVMNAGQLYGNRPINALLCNHSNCLGPTDRPSILFLAAWHFCLHQQAHYWPLARSLSPQSVHTCISTGPLVLSVHTQASYIHHRPRSDLETSKHSRPVLPDHSP